VLPKKYIDEFKESGIALSLYLRSDLSKYVKAKLTCCLVDPISKLRRSQEKIMSGRFNRSGHIYCINLPLVKRSSLLASSYLKDDSFTIECTIEVLIELVEKQETTRRPANDIVSSSGLHHHLGELLQKGTGADVTLVVSGESEESFPAHKAILASRSPVFMAEFFGHMKEQSSQQVQIKGMEAAVLGAMLQFIYTDSVPELDLPEDGMAIAQHLLAAADRYGIDKLKLICEDKLFDGISIDTAAMTLALAHQHGCSLLKAKCVELIVANLADIMATKDYEHLTASCPEVLNELLKAVHDRKN